MSNIERWIELMTNANLSAAEVDRVVREELRNSARRREYELAKAKKPN